MTLWNLGSFANVTAGIAALIGVFLLLRPFLRIAIGSQWISALWVIVLLRLLFPLPLASRWSIQQWFNRETDREEHIVLADEVKVTIGGVVMPESATPLQNSWKNSKRGIGGARNAERIGWIWLAGAVFGAAVMVRRHLHTHRCASRTRPAEDLRLLRAVESLPFDLKHGVQVRQTSELAIAALAGICRPQIWVPDRWLDQLSSAELRDVLMHELGHARRRDLLVQWLFGVAVCLHWFNPLVWIAARAARFDRELACDAWVLERLGTQGTERYGSTLLRIVAMTRAPFRVSPGLVAMATSSKTLGIRFRQIGGYRTPSAWRGAFSALSLLVAVAMLTTTAHTAQSPTASPLATDASLSSKSADTTQPSLEASEILVPQEINGRDRADALIELEGKLVEVNLSALDRIKTGIPSLEYLAEAARSLESASGGGEALPPPEQQSPVVGVITQEQQTALLRVLSGLKGVERPLIKARSGQKASVQSGYHYSYPSDFVADPSRNGRLFPRKSEKTEISATLDALLTIAANGEDVVAQLTSTVTRHLGFKKLDGTFVSRDDPRAAEIDRDLAAANANGILAENLYVPVLSTRKWSIKPVLRPNEAIIIGDIIRAPGPQNEAGEPRVQLVWAKTRIMFDPINIDAEEMSYENSILVARGNGVLRCKQLTLRADKITYDAAKKTAHGEGNVTVTDDPHTVKGNDVEVDLKTMRFKANGPNKITVGDMPTQ